MSYNASSDAGWPASAPGEGAAERLERSAGDGERISPGADTGRRVAAYLDACGITSATRRRDILAALDTELVRLSAAAIDPSAVLLQALEGAVHRADDAAEFTRPPMGVGRLRLAGHAVWPDGKGPLPPQAPAVMPVQRLLGGRRLGMRFSRAARRFRHRVPVLGPAR